jgi:peptidoglycan-N-acetylglucosamine deacetylase
MLRSLFFLTVFFGIFFLLSQSIAMAESVAITFDDGPSPITTPRILNILDEYQAKATFFMTGVNSERFPEIVQEVARRGHEIGNHTYCHFDLQRCSYWALEWQISAAQDVIARIIGFGPKIFRPPYSRINEAARNVLRAKGLKIIMWSVSPADWLDPLPETIAERVLSVIKADDIVVMHDYHPNTAVALSKILEGLRRKQLQPVTISGLGR